MRLSARQAYKFAASQVQILLLSFKRKDYAGFLLLLLSPTSGSHVTSLKPACADMARMFTVSWQVNGLKAKPTNAAPYAPARVGLAFFLLLLTLLLKLCHGFVGVLPRFFFVALFRGTFVVIRGKFMSRRLRVSYL